MYLFLLEGLFNLTQIFMGGKMNFKLGKSSLSDLK